MCCCCCLFGMCIICVSLMVFDGCTQAHTFLQNHMNALLNVMPACFTTIHYSLATALITRCHSLMICIAEDVILVHVLCWKRRCVTHSLRADKVNLFFVSSRSHVWALNDFSFFKKIYWFWPRKKKFSSAVFFISCLVEQYIRSEWWRFCHMLHIRPISIRKNTCLKC